MATSLTFCVQALGDATAAVRDSGLALQAHVDGPLARVCAIVAARRRRQLVPASRVAERRAAFVAGKQGELSAHVDVARQVLQTLRREWEAARQANEAKRAEHEQSRERRVRAQRTTRQTYLAQLKRERKKLEEALGDEPEEEEEEERDEEMATDEMEAGYRELIESLAAERAKVHAALEEGVQALERFEVEQRQAAATTTQKKKKKNQNKKQKTTNSPSAANKEHEELRAEAASLREELSAVETLREVSFDVDGKRAEWERLPAHMQHTLRAVIANSRVVKTMTTVATHLVSEPTGAMGRAVLDDKLTMHERRMLDDALVELDRLGLVRASDESVRLVLTVGSQ